MYVYARQDLFACVNLFLLLLLSFHGSEYSSRFELEDTVLFCLRVMVGVIILYDHIHPVGAFAKTTNIDVSGCASVECVHACIVVECYSVKLNGGALLSNHVYEGNKFQ